MTVPVALTLGDPGGIGGELALRAWDALRGELAFFLIGDLRHMTCLAGRLGLPLAPVRAPGEAAEAMAEGLPVLDHPLPATPLLGRATPEAATAIVAAIARGAGLARDGAAAALCTGPISKQALIEGADFAFPGHTEFLGHLARVAQPVMLLAAPGLRVVPVTVHMALRDVATALTAERIEGAIRVAAAAMETDFGVEAPRIVVSGLNPHAGEGGALGREERELISPVLDRLRAEGLRIRGPLAADSMFHPAARAGYDLAVAMYHDQALIPLKTIDFAGGVNVTLGLDFVRTSPDHGTAFDIAQELRADPASTIAALRLAAELGARRRAGRR